MANLYETRLLLAIANEVGIMILIILYQVIKSVLRYRIESGSILNHLSLSSYDMQARSVRRAPQAQGGGHWGYCHRGPAKCIDT